MILVVAGLIINEEGKVLMTLRRENTSRPNLWESPGGKVEPGELERDALVRELKEELGVEAEVHELVSSAKLCIGTTLEEDAVLLLYRCSIKGTPQPLESQELRWVDFEDAVINLPMCPATYIWRREISNKIIEIVGRIKYTRLDGDWHSTEQECCSILGRQCRVCNYFLHVQPVYGGLMECCENCDYDQWVDDLPPNAEVI